MSAKMNIKVNLAHYCDQVLNIGNINDIGGRKIFDCTIVKVFAVFDTESS